MRRTHAAAGLLIGFSLGAIYASPFPETFLIALVSETASLLPDLDLKLKIKHRTVTHSLLMLLTFALLALYGGVTIWALAFILGYASHLGLDLLTIHGIELFYPYHRRIRVLNLRTDGRVDHLLCVLALCGALYGLVLALAL